MSFVGQFECLGENKEKYKTFSIPIKKEITKMVMKLFKLHLIKSNLLMLQDL